MYPTSTHQGQALAAFPDVCKTPAPPAGPIPIPYPNIGTASAGRKTSPTTKSIATKSTFTKSSGDENGLRGQMGILHHKLMTLHPSNVTAWHATLDEYVVTCAELFKTLSK